MDARGYKILGADQGFTKSHQVLWDVTGLGGGKVIAERLEENNIICNKNMFPWDRLGSEKMVNPSGIRMGVQELTRWGMTEKEMPLVADLLDSVAKGKTVKQDVIQLKSKFNEVDYTF
jgi:glycine hydroxymethyltransferase